MRNFRYHAPIVALALVLLAIISPIIINIVSDNAVTRNCIENSDSEFCQTIIKEKEAEIESAKRDVPDVSYSSDQKEACAKQTDEKLTEFCRVLAKNYETGNVR